MRASAPAPQKIDVAVGLGDETVGHEAVRAIGVVDDVLGRADGIAPAHAAMAVAVLTLAKNPDTTPVTGVVPQKPSGVSITPLTTPP